MHERGEEEGDGPAATTTTNNNNNSNNVMIIRFIITIIMLLLIVLRIRVHNTYTVVGDGLAAARGRDADDVVALQREGPGPRLDNHVVYYTL